MSDQKHLVSIDIVRLISAFAIITIHVSGFTDSLLPFFFNSFFRWGTPMFIIISGYLLISSTQATNPKVFYQHRLQRLSIPFIFWNIFYYFLYSYLNLDYPSIADFFNRFLGGGTFYHLYFLPLIIGLYALTPTIAQNLSRLKLNILVLILILISYPYMFLSFWCGLPQLNNLFTWFLLYIGYYIAGYWLPRTHFRPKLSLVLLTFILPVLGFFGNIYLTKMYGDSDRGEFLTHRLSYLIAIPALTFFQYLINLKLNCQSFGSRIKNLSSLSFGVYLTHPAIIQIFVSVHPFSNFLQKHPILWMFSVIPLTMILTFSLVKALKSIPILNRIV